MEKWDDHRASVLAEHQKNRSRRTPMSDTPLSREAIDKGIAEHIQGVRPGDEYWCQRCEQGWPCDASQALPQARAYLDLCERIAPYVRHKDNCEHADKPETMRMRFDKVRGENIPTVWKSSRRCTCGFDDVRALLPPPEQEAERRE